MGQFTRGLYSGELLLGILRCLLYQMMHFSNLGERQQSIKVYIRTFIYIFGVFFDGKGEDFVSSTAVDTLTGPPVAGTS